MSEFFPFIHKIEKKKKDQEPQPLYVELIPPPPQKRDVEEDETPGVIIIQL